MHKFLISLGFLLATQPILAQNSYPLVNILIGDNQEAAVLYNSLLAPPLKRGPNLVKTVSLSQGNLVLECFEYNGLNPDKKSHECLIANNELSGSRKPKVEQSASSTLITFTDDDARQLYYGLNITADSPKSGEYRKFLALNIFNYNAPGEYRIDCILTATKTNDRCSIREDIMSKND